MPTLRIHHRDRDGARVVELDWDGYRVTVPFRPAVDRFLLEDLRWYHENYRESWAAASEDGVTRIRRAQRAIGEGLYQALFTADTAPLRPGCEPPATGCGWKFGTTCTTRPCRGSC